MADAILFWGHLSVILFAVSTGLWLPLPIVVMLIAVHRVHALAFDGCLFTKVEQRLGALPANLDFLQHAVGRLTGTVINRQQSRSLDYAIVSTALVIAVGHTVIVG